jgi:hypothetical protein
MRSTKVISPSIRHFRTIPQTPRKPHNQRMESPYIEQTEPTAEQTLRLRIVYLESDLQREHDENRQLRKRLSRAEATLGIDVLEAA